MLHRSYTVALPTSEHTSAYSAATMGIVAIKLLVLTGEN
jgi:hypothetical protein